MDRLSRLLGSANRSISILEIGPGYCPAAPKGAGWQTHVVDHASQQDLRAKYATANVDTGLIEHVDTIWPGGKLHDVVPAALLGQVDLIIASHVLEHLPDLLGFFQSASQLVKADGSLSIALPDRRYCFDCFRPATTTGAVLEAHCRGSGRHGLKTAFDHMAYSAVVEGQLAWGPYPTGTPVLLDPFQAAAATFDAFIERPDQVYQDYHAWQFTPAGFRLLMLELSALGLSDWQVHSLEGPENFEFFAVLRRGNMTVVEPAALQGKRQELLLAQLAETREQADFILGSQAEPALAVPDGHEELLAKLIAQGDTLREMSETLALLRQVLNRVRRFWRLLRRTR